jgi:hypothetical protein
MRYVKHLSVALMALGLSAPVLAMPYNVLTVPSQSGGLKVGVDTLYLSTNAVTTSSDSSYDFGFNAQIGYLIPCTGNDISLDYLYFHNDNKDTMNLDTVDLTLGQRLTSGAFDMHFFGGMRYAHTAYSLNGDEESIVSKFHGFGPRFGMNTRYQFSNSPFGLDTHINTTLLAGTLSNRYQNEKESGSQSMNRIIPQVGAKIGLDYTCPFTNAGKSALTIEVGYQTEHYFKAVDNVIVSGSSDASFDGPYLGIKYYA